MSKNTKTKENRKIDKKVKQSRKNHEKIKKWKNR